MELKSRGTIVSFEFYIQSEDNQVRLLPGMILGCLLTIAAVYMHDSMATSTVASGPAATVSRSIVNWDVAATEWGYVKDNVRTAWAKLTNVAKT